MTPSERQLRRRFVARRTWFGDLDLCNGLRETLSTRTLKTEMLLLIYYERRMLDPLARKGSETIWN
jgi:hypothetical protein